LTLQRALVTLWPGALTITCRSDWLRGSRQKPRLLPAATKPLSEKSASATFFQ
jgi:hypothetical protein